MVAFCVDEEYVLGVHQTPGCMHASPYWRELMGEGDAPLCTAYLVLSRRVQHDWLRGYTRERNLDSVNKAHGVQPSSGHNRNDP